MDNNTNTTNSGTITSRLRRFAIGSVAALAGLGLAGAGTAAAATPAPDTVEVVEAVNDVAYDVRGGLAELPPADIPGFISGGHIFVDGTGYLEVTSWFGTEVIEIKSSSITPLGGFLTVTYQGVDYFGPLEAAGFNVFDAELMSMWGMELGIESLILTPASS